MNNKLKCPFCGGNVRILVCDDEGNIHSEEYEEDPWSGLGYQLTHKEKDVPEGEECPIAKFDDDGSVLGIHIYDNREEAIAYWNYRV